MSASTNAVSRRGLLVDPAEAARRGMPLYAAADGALLSREETQAIVERP
ncbi:MAG: hypothetical protein ACXW61_15250 [Gemmatirosa sp.]